MSELEFEIKMLDEEIQAKIIKDPEQQTKEVIRLCAEINAKIMERDLLRE